MQKVLLYYKFVPLKDPEAVRFWQTSLLQMFNLKGRIIIAEHGINGTVGGETADLKNYIKLTKSFSPFQRMSFKWSEGSRDDFPRINVKVRPEIVTFNALNELKVDSSGVVGGGKHLKPKQVNELVKNNPEVVFFDGRNAYEAAIGKFKDAVVPDIRHTREFVSELEKPEYQKLKDKPIVTYCTGGIRCEVLSMLMKNRGFKEVYQIDGGVVKYGEEFGNSGFWEGALYVFDGRIKTKFSSHSKDIGQCIHCSGRTSNYENCEIKSCNDLVLICNDCLKRTHLCSVHDDAKSSKIPKQILSETR